MNPLTEIISKLEKATGPSRYLDAEIAAAVGLDTGMFIWDGQRNFVGVQNNITVPHYTSSIDSALMLVPEGDPWTFWQNQSQPRHHRHWLACVNEYGPDQEVRSRGTGTHPTSAAIALCIAALRSRGEQ